MSKVENHIFISTVPDKPIAEAIAKGLIEARLAACVNLIPGVTSIYRWKDKIEQDQEVILLIKSEIKLLPSVEEFISRHHPYELPELISVSIENGSIDYLAWLNQQLQ